MKTFAMYRVLYGDEYMEKSIKSIIDDVDRVFIFWTDKPWGNATHGIMYKGKFVGFPKQFDNIVEVARKVQGEYPEGKVVIQYDHRKTPFNQHKLLFDQYIKPHGCDTLLAIEPDMIFAPGDFKKALDHFHKTDERYMTFNQIELWKNIFHRIPFRRGRVGPILYNIQRTGGMLPTTHFNGWASDKSIPLVYSPIMCYNFGFAVNDQTMYWKHLTSIAFSKYIGDSEPYENWYDRVWLRWNKFSQNLAPSKKYTSTIPRAAPYELPEEMKEYLYAD
jgi:hypothetical protein